MLVPVLLVDLADFVTRHRPGGQLTGDATEPAANGYMVTYSMPGDTGLRLLAHARDRPRPVPVIALTGYAGMQVTELDGAPFARVLGKPIDPWRLCREVRDVVQGA